MASSSEQTTTKQKVGLNRRTLIRTGTHVAWAVPAVAMVSPTPAFAASGLAALTLGGNPGTWSPGGLLSPARQRVVLSTFSVGNTGPAATTGLQVVLTLPNGLVTASPLDAIAPGWSATGTTGTRVVTFTADNQLPSGGSVDFKPAIRTTSDFVSVFIADVTFTVSATNAAGIPGTADRA